MKRASKKVDIIEEVKAKLQKALAYLKSGEADKKFLTEKIETIINGEFFTVGTAFLAAYQAIEVIIPKGYSKGPFYVAFLIAALLKIMDL